MHTHDSNPTDPTAPRGPADLKTGSGIVRGLLGMATAWWLIGALLLWLVDRGLAKNDVGDPLPADGVGVGAWLFVAVAGWSLAAMLSDVRRPDSRHGPVNDVIVAAAHATLLTAAALSWQLIVSYPDTGTVANLWARGPVWVALPVWLVVFAMGLAGATAMRSMASARPVALLVGLTWWLVLAPAGALFSLFLRLGDQATSSVPTAALAICAAAAAAGSAVFGLVHRAG